MTLVKETIHPYRLANTFTVSAEKVLTVESGVTVIGHSQTSRLVISGTLLANATGESDRIAFTSGQATPAGGDWDYIHFAPGSSGSLKYVTIEYAGGNSDGDYSAELNRAALYIDSSPTLDHVVIREVANADSRDMATGIWLRYEAAPVISNSMITADEYYGIYAAQSDATAAVGNYQLLNNQLTGKYSGAYLYLSTNAPIVRGNE